MKLKRISAILAASVIALSFAGCSSGGDSSGSASAASGSKMCIRDRQGIYCFEGRNKSP